MREGARGCKEGGEEGAVRVEEVKGREGDGQTDTWRRGQTMKQPAKLKTTVEDNGGDRVSLVSCE